MKIMIANKLIISIFAIIFAGLSLFTASKPRNNQVINLIGYLVALIFYGVFLDFGIQFVNDSSGGDISILGLVLLIGGSVYFACTLSDRVRSKR